LNIRLLVANESCITTTKISSYISYWLKWQNQKLTPPTLIIITFLQLVSHVPVGLVPWL
jgi:hypothetical protein